MAVKQITQHDVRSGIKHGLDIDAFCEKYKCTHAEFERRIRNLYRQSAPDILDEIHNNAKKRNRAGGAKSLLKSAPAPQKLQDGNDIPFATTISLDSTLNRNGHSTTDELKVLQAKEREQSDAIMALESKHKSIAREHRDRIRKLRDIQEAMTQIKADFEAKAAEYQALVEENNQLVSQMNAISQSRASQLTLLEETRHSIQALSTIIIYAYENGNIEPMEDASGFKPDESGSEQLYTSLLNRAECEELRLKDIRVLSRMLSIVSNTHRTVEPIFENAALEPFFEALQAQAV